MLDDKRLERDGLEALKQYLDEAGIRVRSRRKQPSPADSGVDAELEVRLPSGDRRHLLVEFKANPRKAPLEGAIAQLRNSIAHSAHSDAIPLLFSSHLGKPVRNWLRSQRMWFADLSGNRFFQAPALLVDREVSEKPEAAREPAPSVFADRSSLIVRYLLPRPPVRIGIRQLAREVRLSPASVSKGLHKLREMGYLESNPEELRLLDRESLLDEWVSFYRPRFRRQVQSRYYVQARSAEVIIGLLGSEPIAGREDCGLSLHAGASLVAPFVQFREVHMYVPANDDRFLSQLRDVVGAREPAGEANLVLLEPFYRSSVLFGSRILQGVRVVSDLQLYLDLSCFPQRGFEQAQVILERRLRPAWSGL